MDMQDVRGHIEQAKYIKSWLGSGSINFFGYPFAGKDTQARLLAGMLGATIISSGQILRNSSLSVSTRRDLELGNLISQQQFMKIILPALERQSQTTGPLILSSVGRQIAEQAAVSRALSLADHPMRAAIYLKVDRDNIIDRWHGSQSIPDERDNRPDDQKSLIIHRLQEFETKTLPVIQHYKSKMLLIEIDGNQTTKQVTSGILDALYIKSTTSA